MKICNLSKNILCFCGFLQYFGIVMWHVLSHFVAVFSFFRVVSEPGVNKAFSWLYLTFQTPIDHHFKRPSFLTEKLDDCEIDRKMLLRHFLKLGHYGRWKSCLALFLEGLRQEGRKD